MANKKVQKEEDVDINVSAPSNNTFATRWFKDNAVNNSTELKNICDMTARSAQEQFCMHLEKGNTEVYAVVFYATFMSILEFIREKQKRYTNFTLAIANSVNLGYSNNDDENNEKVGNFMPIMEYIGVNQRIMSDEKLTEDATVESYIKWKNLNSKKEVEYYKEIQEVAYNKLKKEYKVGLRSSEAVFPLFCIFLDLVTSMTKERFDEAKGTSISEISMNVLGLFDIFYSYDEEEGRDVFEYQPNITMKLALKSDSVAGRD